jgi:hypothetical protein
MRPRFRPRLKAQLPTRAVIEIVEVAIMPRGFALVWSAAVAGLGHPLR